MTHNVSVVSLLQRTEAYALYTIMKTLNSIV